MIRFDDLRLARAAEYHYPYEVGPTWLEGGQRGVLDFVARVDNGELVWDLQPLTIRTGVRP